MPSVDNDQVPHAIEQFVIGRSCGGTRHVFYLTSYDIAGATGIPRARISAFMRHMDDVKVVAGYSLTPASVGKSRARTYKVTKVEYEDVHT